MIRGVNHITLAVVDLGTSVAFYRDMLGLRLRARWHDGAYLESGNLWLCLSVGPAAASRPQADDTHIAFDVDAPGFEIMRARLAGSAPRWRDNHSEGASLYILDPDNHKIELHVGSLDTRLAHYRDHLPKGMILYD